MTYRPPRRSGLVAPVSPRSAKVLLVLLPSRERMLHRLRYVDEETRADFEQVIDTLRAAALEYDRALREGSVSGSMPAPVLDSVAESRKGAAVLSGMHAFPVGEAAELLGVSSRRVRQLLDLGRLEGQKCGSQWLITAESIRDYQKLKGAA